MIFKCLKIIGFFCKFLNINLKKKIIVLKISEFIELEIHNISCWVCNFEL